MIVTDLEHRGEAVMSSAARRIRRALRGNAGTSTRSNLVAGASTVLGVVPCEPRRRIVASRFMARTDAEAIGEDWYAVGDDLRAVARRAR